MTDAVQKQLVASVANGQFKRVGRWSGFGIQTLLAKLAFLVLLAFVFALGTGNTFAAATADATVTGAADGMKLTFDAIFTIMILITVALVGRRWLKKL